MRIDEDVPKEYNGTIKLMGRFSYEKDITKEKNDPLLPF